MLFLMQSSGSRNQLGVNCGIRQLLVKNSHSIPMNTDGIDTNMEKTVPMVQIGQNKPTE